MNLATHRPQISLRFRIEPDGTTDMIGALENALATARRGGTALHNLRAGLGTHGLEIWMRLSADDVDVLALCRTRLANLVGVTDLIDIKEITESIADGESTYECVALEA